MAGNVPSQRLAEDDNTNRPGGRGRVGMFGNYLAARRKELGLSVTALAEKTGIHRSYISDAENDRKFPSAAWVQQLAAVDPPDPELYEAYQRAVVARAAAAKWPDCPATVDLVRELVEVPLARRGTRGEGGEAGAEPPKEGRTARPVFSSFSGRTNCLTAAFRLLERAARTGPPSRTAAGQEPELEAVLLVYAPSLERSDFDWRSVLRDAIDAGWTVVHVLGAGPVETGAQIQRVHDLMSLISRGSAYVPLVLPEETNGENPPASDIEIIVAPGHGVLHMFAAGTAATFFPWHGQYLEVCRNMARTAQTVRAKATQLLSILLSDDPVPSANQHDANQIQGWLEPLPAKVVFDQALTEAAGRPGRRALLKSGLVLATMPPHLTLKLSARMKSAARSEIHPLIDSLTVNRLRRWHGIHEGREHPTQHLCSIPAIRAYLATDDEEGRAAGGPLFVEADPLFSGALSRQDRIEHMASVVELLRTSNHYEVGLVQSPDAVPVPVGKAYWYCTESALFFVKSRQDHASGTRYVTIRDRGVINGFFQVFDSTWSAIPAQWRDRKFVADRIEEWIHRAEDGGSMMDQPMSYAELG